MTEQETDALDNACGVMGCEGSGVHHCLTKLNGILAVIANTLITISDNVTAIKDNMTSENEDG